MGGDGMGAMAAAILAAMALMVVVPFALSLWVGRAVARRRGTTPARAWAIGGAAGLAGLGIGSVALTATFFENAWAPPPTIRFVPATGSDPDWIVLLEDRRVGVPLDWRGVEMPFRRIETRIAVPPGGVVRVASLDRLAGRGDIQAVWPDGSTAMGYSAGPAPAGLGAASFAAWTRKPWDGPEDDLPMEDALADWVRAREGPRGR